MNRQISHIELEEVGPQFIEFGIEYEVISDISADLQEPDTLEFAFKL